MNNLVTSEGKANNTMIIMTVGVVLNIILEPIFIYQLNMEINGCFYATTISQALSTVLYLNMIKKNLRNTKFDAEILNQIFKIGIPYFSLPVV